MKSKTGAKTPSTASGKRLGRPSNAEKAAAAAVAPAEVAEQPDAAEAPADSSTRRKRTTTKPVEDETINLEYDSQGRASLAHLLKQEPNDIRFKIWLVGTTPLITHAWSHKAKLEMLSKQVKSARGGRTERKPEEDYQSALYEFPDNDSGVRRYGFPAMGIKNAVLSVAHKDKGIPKTSLMSALWVDADIVSVRPAHDQAICDMPLLRIHGSDPQMREDMVRVGAMVKTSTLAYRAQFSNWALRVTGRLNTDVVSPTQFVYLVSEAGRSIGLGEWRNERRGVFGAFRLANPAEMVAWDAFADGLGPIPVRLEPTDEVVLAAAE